MIILLAGVLMAGFKLVGYVNAFVIMLPVLLVMFGASWVFPNASARLTQIDGESLVRVLGALNHLNLKQP